MTKIEKGRDRGKKNRLRGRNPASLTDGEMDRQAKRDEAKPTDGEMKKEERESCRGKARKRWTERHRRHPEMAAQGGVDSRTEN